MITPRFEFPNVSSFEINEFVPDPARLIKLMNTATIPPAPSKQLLTQIDEADKALREMADNCVSQEDPAYKRTLSKYIELTSLARNMQRDHNLGKFIHIFKAYKIEGILNNIANNITYTNGTPTITYLILKLSDIIKVVTNPDEYLFCLRFNILDQLVKTNPITIPTPFLIPRFNLFHVGSICHFNTCVNILTSLTTVTHQLSIICQEETTIPIVRDIYQYILNSSSFLDLRPDLIPQILMSLNISMAKTEEAAETMKKILRVLYISGLPKSTLFYWDATDEFDKPKESQSLSAKLEEIEPLYFMCNVHDFNSIYNIDSNHIYLQSFDVINDPRIPENEILNSEDEKVKIINPKPVVSYKLLCFAIFSNGHYVSAFVKGNLEDETLVIKNDLSNRYINEETKNGNVFKPYQEHTIACYLRCK